MYKGKANKLNKELADMLCRILLNSYINRE